MPDTPQASGARKDVEFELELLSSLILPMGDAANTDTREARKGEVRLYTDGTSTFLQIFNASTDTWHTLNSSDLVAPSDVDYLVGTTDGDLSAEIVVGTSPGGELGNTWASPTVDSTHSGSAHHDESHTVASHSDTTGTGTELNTLTDGSSADSLHAHSHDNLSGVSANDHHNESHTVASHSDTTGTGTELNTLTDGSSADSLHAHSHDNLSGVSSDDHHAQAHTVASHSDTSGTGAELNELTDGSETTLHSHAGAATVIHKGSDEDVTSSTTLQNDDDFTFSVDANATYIVEALWLLEGLAAGSFDFQWSLPSGATIDGNVNNSYTSDVVLHFHEGAELNLDITTDPHPNTVTATLITSGTSGTATLQWAQQTSSGTATTMKAGSWLRYQKIT